MGNWNISIRGVGPHHNGIKDDVEQIASRLVAELRAAGHSIASASVTMGSEVVIAQSVDLTAPGTPPLKET